MKTMTCRQLGGACEKQFSADNFEDLVRQSQQHGQEMMAKKDAAHLTAMQNMQALMQQAGAMKQWMDDRRREFDALPGS